MNWLCFLQLLQVDSYGQLEVAFFKFFIHVPHKESLSELFIFYMKEPNKCVATMNAF